MTTYRLDRAIALQAVGALVIAAAVLVFGGFLLSGRDGWVGVVGWVLAALALVGLLAGARFAWRPPVVVRLDEHGLRGRGQRVRWVDVEKVDVADGMLVLSGDDVATAGVPLQRIGRRRAELLREVYDRLNTARGYRRFDPTA